jgi:predicted HAD superfamily phosphohydrolase YqeG
MSEMLVLDQSGDTKIEWDPSDRESTQKAKEEFAKLKKDGYEFFEVAETKGKRVTRFSKKLGKVIAAPAPAKTEAQRKGGRAMAGGPLDSKARGLGSLPQGFADIGRGMADIAGAVAPRRR